MGCNSSDASPETAAGADSAYVKVVNVEVRSVQPVDFTSAVRITGVAEADDDVTVSAEEGGTLERFFVDKGARVAAGAAIAKIDDDLLRAQRDEARAAASLAEERYARQKELWEEKGIGSEITFLQTKYQADEANARLAALERRLARTVIRAPVGGVVDDRYVEAGELVVPGTRIVRVIDTSRLRITGGVPERFGPSVQAGGSATITFDVLPDTVFEGLIEFVGAAVDPASRTFPVDILMPNPGGRVKPAMVANVRVATERLDGVIVVPRDVVLRTEDGYQVFVVGELDGRAVAMARQVVLGPGSENEVVVTGGLESGDRVVIKGQQMVDAGDRVLVVGGEGR
jgi:RND family efflux transporter MFP subunit